MMMDSNDPECESCFTPKDWQPGDECQTPGDHRTPERHQVWVKIGKHFEIRGTGVAP